MLSFALNAKLAYTGLAFSIPEKELVIFYFICLFYFFFLMESLWVSSSFISFSLPMFYCDCFCLLFNSSTILFQFFYYLSNAFMFSLRSYSSMLIFAFSCSKPIFCWLIKFSNYDILCSYSEITISLFYKFPYKSCAFSSRLSLKHSSWFAYFWMISNLLKKFSLYLAIFSLSSSISSCFSLSAISNSLSKLSYFSYWNLS